MKFTFNWVEEIDDGIICGQLSDDRYFIGFDFDDYDQDVWFFDEDPQYIFFADDGDPWEEYIDDYNIGELPSNQKEQFWNDASAFSSEQNTSSNYKFAWVEVLDPEYVIFGQLTNGEYFTAGGFRTKDEEPMVAFVDCNPAEYWDADDEYDDEMSDWFEDHIYKELANPENLKFWETLTAYCEDKGYW